MRVPLEWLNDMVSVNADVQTIAEKLTMGGLEVENIELEKSDECPSVPVLDVYITPNRGDCLSVAGAAREISALFNATLKLPSPPPSQNISETDQSLRVVIQNPELCSRYSARILTGIKIKPSPLWMQNRLISAGMRPINNVVDVTNYVMLELGQPLHAFDLNSLDGTTVNIRKANQNETITTLDDTERILNSDMLVIADSSHPIAIAGVMGGKDSEVSDRTRNIILESAHFDPLSIRRTARSLNLRTEASYRFERNVDPEGVIIAVDRACELLLSLCPDATASGHYDVHPKSLDRRRIKLRATRASQLLGIPITSDVIVQCLTSLGLECETNDNGVADVTIPFRRADLQIEEDLIEEIGRIHGYDQIPEKLPYGITTRGGDSEEGKFLSKIRNILSGCGLTEMVNHSLTGVTLWDMKDAEPSTVHVKNVLSSELSLLRRSLLPGLVQAAERNTAFGKQSMSLFEIGHVWQMLDDSPAEYNAVGGLITGQTAPSDWRISPKIADLPYLKGVVDDICGRLNLPPVQYMVPQDPKSVSQFHPGRVAHILCNSRIIGVIGELHPGLAGKLSLRNRTYLFEISVQRLFEEVDPSRSRFAPPSRFPSIMRDMAPRIEKSVHWSQIEETLKSANIPILQNFHVTNVYTGHPVPENLKSITVSLNFRSDDGTLTSEIVDKAVDTLKQLLISKNGAVFPA